MDMYIQKLHLQNLFYKASALIRLSGKKMKNDEFHYIIATLILGSVLVIVPIALSYLTANIVVHNKGEILPLTKTSILYKSEIRGVHIIDAVLVYPHDWNVIAETLANYKINFVTLLFMGLPNGLAEDSEWRAALQAFHSRGIEVWISYHVVGEMAVKEEYKFPDASGDLVDWNDPCNPNFIQEVKETVEYVARNYDIDGIMFDYARYPGEGMPYSQYDKAEFEKWLGETIPDSNWPPNRSDFAPGGARYNEFMDWRVLPIANLLRNVRNWMLAINPNLKFGLAQWTLFGNPPDYSPSYWRYWIGQDAAYYVKEGIIDITMPMMYYDPAEGYPHSVQANLEANWKYITGGPEGKIPLLAFINTGNPYAGDTRDPQEVKACIDKSREMGADGWILWCYGGPGIDDDGWFIDIRPYLDLLDIPETFSIRNINISTDGTQTTIRWTTDLPATSKVEYNKTDLFIATKKELGGFWIWDIDHIEGIIIEDTTIVTSHSITITELTPGQKYYFRIQSQNENGTATIILTFTISSSYS